MLSIYVYIQIYIYMNTYIYTYILLHTDTYRYAYIPRTIGQRAQLAPQCLQRHRHTYTHTHSLSTRQIPTHMHTQAHTYRHIQKCTHTTCNSAARAASASMPAKAKALAVRANTTSGMSPVMRSHIALTCVMTWRWIMSCTDASLCWLSHGTHMNSCTCMILLVHIRNVSRDAM